MKKIFLFCLIATLTSCSALYDKPYNDGKPYYRGPTSNHFDGRKFISDKNASFVNDVRSLFILKSSWTDFPQDEIEKTFNQLKPVENRARITFVGHSTFLIQLANANILTDPIWSNRAGPFPWPVFSVHRHNPPAINFDDLPRIDYVLFSHSSYYHMDLPTIKKLKEKFNPKFLAGLGSCYYLNSVKKLGLDCIELDWEQKIALKDATEIYFLEAKNWSQRSWFDTNKTLWGSFAILSPDIKIYFAGDTGYSDHLRVIGNKYGPFDVALLPIGSYEPRWRMQYHHMNPEEAVKSHISLNSAKSIGMHFNTFQTTHEGYFDAKIALEEAKITYSLRGDEFVAPKFGEVFEF